MVSGISLLPDRSERYKNEALRLQREKLDLEREQMNQYQNARNQAAMQKNMADVQKQMTDLFNLNYSKVTGEYDKDEIVKKYDDLQNETMEILRTNFKTRGASGVPLDLNQQRYLDKKKAEIESTITMAEYNSTAYGQRAQEFAGTKGGQSNKVNAEKSLPIWEQAEKELFQNPKATVSDRYKWLSMATPVIEEKAWAPADIFKASDANIEAATKQVASTKFPGKQDIQYDPEETRKNLLVFFAGQSPKATEWKQNLKSNYKKDFSDEEAADFFKQYGASAASNKFAGSGININVNTEAIPGTPSSPGTSTSGGKDVIPANTYVMSETVNGKKVDYAVKNPIEFTYKTAITHGAKTIDLSGEMYDVTTGNKIKEAPTAGKTPVEVTGIRYYATKDGQRVPDYMAKDTKGKRQSPYLIGNAEVKDPEYPSGNRKKKYQTLVPANVDNLRTYFETIASGGGSMKKYMEGLSLDSYNINKGKWEVVSKETLGGYTEDDILKAIADGLFLLKN
jgi:hypothetical protein